MALIGMAVYSTEENGKDDCLEKTLHSLMDTVDYKKHRIILSVNSATDRTHSILKWYDPVIADVIFNNENIGTAAAINKAWRLREPGEDCIKMDDDVVINYKGWVEEMEEAIQRDPSIGQIGLKRKDCWEYPYHE